jgi:hypothetical protein
MATTIGLLAATGLMLRTVVNLATLDRGFDPRTVAAMEISLPKGMPVEEQNARLRDLDKVLALVPGVRNSGLVDMGIETELGNVDSLRLPDEREVYAEPRSASPGLARTLGLRMRSGTWFSDAPTQERLVVLNRTLAGLCFGNADPVGRPFDLYGKPARVIGVVEDTLADPRHAAKPGQFEAQRAEEAALLALLRILPASVLQEA